jgi:GNAT superfamily N-acetyltransferase
MVELRQVESEGDIDAFLAVRREIDPEHPVARHAYLQHLQEPGRLDLLARVDRTPVAAAFAEPHHGNVAGDTAYASVRVLPARRRRGIGSALFKEVSGHARGHGWHELYSVARHDDADTLDYLGKRGFAEVLRMQELSLELAAAESRADPPQGIELVPLGPELEQAAYDAAHEIYPDIPEEDGAWIGDFDAWRREALPAHTLRDCTFAALDDGRLVGYATLFDAGDGVGLHGMTGVRPSWRGRGIAAALKRAQVAAARAAGLRELRTTTAFANAPMLHVNERLGFRRGVAWVHLRGPLLDGTAP